jgi:NADH:ubiquinone oxidoreductase subunit 4 (subunit M)
MLLSALILIPFFGIFFILSHNSYALNENSKILKTFALGITVIDLVISLII